MIFHIQWYFKILIFYSRSENVKILGKKKHQIFKSYWSNGLRHWAEGSSPDPAAFCDEYIHKLIFCRHFPFTKQDSLNLLDFLKSYFFHSIRNRYWISPDLSRWPIGYPITRNSWRILTFFIALLAETNFCEDKKFQRRL